MNRKPAVLGAALAQASFFLVLWSNASPRIGFLPAPATIRPPGALERFLGAYGVACSWDPVRGRLGDREIRGDAPFDGERRAAGAVVARSLGRYPASLFARGVLRRVHLMRGLTLDGESIAGTVSCDPPVLYLDAAVGAMHPAHLERTVHHELYHLLDCWDDGVVEPDPEWMSIQAAGEPYVAALRAFEPLQGAAEPYERARGFVSLYARASVAEDKAELFEFLMCDREYVVDRARRDPLLRRKADLLRRRLIARCPDLARLLRD